MKSSKKLLAVFLSVLMIIPTVSVCFVSGAATVCNHKIGIEYTTSTMYKHGENKATCQLEGIAYYACSNCDYTTKRVIPLDPDNHQFGDWLTVTEPGCATDGEAIRHCVCGASETDVLPATGKHTYPDEALLDFWWKAKNAGVGTTYEGWKIVELPTCASTGLAKTSCLECGGAEITAELQLHSADFYEAKREESTCAFTGKSYVVCKKCNANYTLTVPVNEENHEISWKVITEATCTKEGVEASYCRWHINLGTFETRAIPVKEHVFTNYKYDNNAGCGVDGTKTATCNSCKATDTVTAENTARVCLKRWQFVNGNCKDGGDAKLACVYCKTTYEEKTFAAGEHINITVVTVKPTCKDAGYKYLKCETCGYESNPIEGTATDKIDHIRVWVEKTAPNCILRKNGIEIGTCTMCGETEERPVPFEHNYVDVVPVVPATCTEDGETAYLRCITCNDEVPPKPIPAFGHDDTDGNGCCNTCYEWFLDGTPEGPSCRCICHNPDGIAALFYKIYLFFIKLFGAAQECGCGALHYEK